MCVPSGLNVFCFSSGFAVIRSVRRCSSCFFSVFIFFLFTSLEHHSNNKHARRDLSVSVDDVITPSERTHISEAVVTSYGLELFLVLEHMCALRQTFSAERFKQKIKIPPKKIESFSFDSNR